jgi:hypothetical protein
MRTFSETIEAGSGSPGRLVCDFGRLSDFDLGVFFLSRLATALPLGFEENLRYGMNLPNGRNVAAQALGARTLALRMAHVEE